MVVIIKALRVLHEGLFQIYTDITDAKLHIQEFLVNISHFICEVKFGPTITYLIVLAGIVEINVFLTVNSVENGR